MSDNVESIEKNLPHKVSEVICLKCLTRWICIRPCSVMSKKIECCGCNLQGFVIETGDFYGGEE